MYVLKLELPGIGAQLKSHTPQLTKGRMLLHVAFGFYDRLPATSQVIRLGCSKIQKGVGVDKHHKLVQWDALDLSTK